MATENANIIIIGPVCAGKSTQGKLISKALNKQLVSLDAVAEDYYKANGFGESQFQKAVHEKGFLSAYRQWWPSLAYAAQQVVTDYTNCVIDFGAGHSHYEDDFLYSGVKEALAGCQDVVLLLPAEDLDRSVSLLRERSKDLRNMDWIFDGYDFFERWVKDDSNHDLATVTIFTDGKTPEQTCEEILKAIGVHHSAAAGTRLNEKRISDIDFQELEKRMSPILHAVAISHFERDYETFQTYHHSIVAKAAFQNAASALQSYGKPVDVKYLGCLMKKERIKLLWKVAYSDSKVEVLWEFHIEIDGNQERIVGMGIDI
ncbi:MAG: hypothetical protein AB8B79_19200 [Granulosicoccus sp.]